MKITRIEAALFITAIFTIPVMARADLYCPQQISLFGTVTSVNGSVLTLRTTSDIGSIHVRMNRPAMHAHGLRLRPGVFAGVYGCLERGGAAFNADEVTLARSESAYVAYTRRQVTIEGRITAIQSGRVLIAANGGHGNVWVRGRSRGVRIGELVRATGSFDPREGEFVASGIDRIR